jgi:hypothetical protein
MLSRPPLDLGAQPELQSSSAAINDGTRHLGVAGLVFAHRVAMRQAKDRCHILGIDERVDVNSASHNGSVSFSSAEPYGRKLPSAASSIFRS